MCRVRDGLQVGDATENVGILHHDAAGVFIDPRDQASRVGRGLHGGRGMRDFVIGEFRHGLDDLGIVRVQRAREHDFALFAPSDATGHRHRFPAGGRAIIHARIGHRAAIETRDLALEFEQHLQRALRDFRLVGRVGGQELAALDDVIDAGGDMVLIRPCPEEERRVGRRQVLLRQPPHMLFDRHFAGMHRQPMDRAIEPCLLGHIGEQRIHIGCADFFEHRRTVGVGQGKVAHSYSNSPYRLREGSEIWAAQRS